MNQQNKRSLLVIVGSCLFIFAWYGLVAKLGWLTPPARPPASPADLSSPAVSPDSPSIVPGVAAVEEEFEDGQRGESRPPAELPRLASSAVSGDWARPAPSTVGPATLTAADKRLSLRLDAERGGLVEAWLHEFRPYGQVDADQPVRLGNWRHPFCAVELPGLVPSTMVQIDGGLVLERATPGGLTVTERWLLDPAAPYRLLYTITLANGGDQPVEVAPQLSLGGITAEVGGADPKMARMGAMDLGIDLAADWLGRPESLAVKHIRGMDEGDQARLAQRPVAWIAIQNKYFVFFLKPRGGEAGGGPGLLRGIRVGASTGPERPDDTDPAALPVDWIHAVAALPPLVLASGGTTTLEFDAYVGPKTLSELRQLAPNAEAMMRLDLFMFFRANWMGAIAKGILGALIWLNGWFGSVWGYGYAIIVVTFVIKMLFWPLTHRSTVSMRRMAALQPQIQQLREKHKDDAQLMNRKIMEFYRENKVSPLGGCLPMLLQIPVFFALFNTLRGAIELRHAAFFYISDLSMPDTLAFQPFGPAIPIRPLAILMAATMLLQQKMTPTTGDPSQKKMMTFMSIFFMFIFYGMPSGLTLYWTTNQVLTIIQNLIGNRLENKTGAAVQPAGTGGAKAK